MRDEFKDLRNRIDEVFKAVVIAVVWLTIVAIVCAVVPAFGSEPTSGEVTFSSMTCYTDPHFFDGWQTVTTASVNLSAYTKQELNQLDLEVWSDGVRLMSMPARSQGINVTGIARPSFKLVDRLTLERRTLTKSPYMSAASCSIMPPPHNAAWLWDEDAGQFVLKIVKHIENLEAVPFDIELEWSYSVVEVEE